MSRPQHDSAGPKFRDLPLNTTFGAEWSVPVLATRALIASVLLFTVVVLVNLIGRVLLIEVIGHIPGG